MQSQGLRSSWVLGRARDSRSPFACHVFCSDNPSQSASWGLDGDPDIWAGNSLTRSWERKGWIPSREDLITSVEQKALSCGQRTTNARVASLAPEGVPSTLRLPWHQPTAWATETTCPIPQIRLKRETSFQASSVATAPRRQIC